MMAAGYIITPLRIPKDIRGTVTMPTSRLMIPTHGLGKHGFLTTTAALNLICIQERMKRGWGPLYPVHVYHAEKFRREENEGPAKEIFV